MHPFRWPVAGFAILAAGCAAYAFGLQLPFISDDYIQIGLAREYGPLTGWVKVLEDPLYRCRQVSLVITYWTEQAFGLTPVAYNASSLALHVANSWLVYALWAGAGVGPPAALVAGLFFAAFERPQEAVLWYAALPELLVFFFSLLALIAWRRWFRRAPGHRWWGAAAFAFYVLGLFSKESAVVVPALMLLVAWHEARGGLPDRPELRRVAVALVPFVLAAGLYAAAVFGARERHGFFYDGTFQVQAGFVEVLVRSAARLLWVWGLLGAAYLLFRGGRRYWRAAGVAVIWIVLTLLPYSFLTYMPQVPSRHTYFASAAVALLFGVGLMNFAERIGRPGRVVAGVVLVAALASNMAYLWTRKRAQFLERAVPTERLLETAARHERALSIRCFPYDDNWGLTS